ncbi:hypothetical protein M758_7G138400 [Ceratodon purpureus]|nr:hypothetical protein M758_7G138400 [Ceratodon purpureus]
MGAPERKAKMESEKMKECEESTLVSSVEVDSPKDQFAWSQYMHDAQFLDFSSFSPNGLITPREFPNSFPDLSTICQSPMFADQWKFLQAWSPRVTSNSDSETAPVVTASEVPSVSDQVKQIQSLNLSRVSNSEPGVSTSVSTSCDSEGPSSSGDLKRGMSCAESSGSKDEKTRTRKRKSVEPDEKELETVDDASDAEEMEESKDIANKPSRSKQQKVKSAKRMREPRYAIKTRTEVDIMEDGYKWRKYGQKPVKNSPHPRNYYRCTTANCPVRKRVERSTEDPGLVVTSYEGTHTHPKVNQPKRTASGTFAPMEAAESLSESLNQLQNRQQQAAASNNSSPLAPFPQVPNLFSGFPGWPNPLVNRQMPSTGALPSSLQDNVGLMMAYQIVKLQWELQAKTQQFMNYNAQAGGFPGGLPKANPFMDPFGFLQAQNMTLPDMAGMMSSFNGESSDSDAELERTLRFPKVPEALNSGRGSLLARRAAQRTGSPLNPNLQTNGALKMQQFLAQAMAGMQQAALEQQEALGEGHADQG